MKYLFVEDTSGMITNASLTQSYTLSKKLELIIPLRNYKKVFEKIYYFIYARWLQILTKDNVALKVCLQHRKALSSDDQY